MEETTEKEDARKIVVYRPEVDLIRKMYVFCDFQNCGYFFHHLFIRIIIIMFRSKVTFGVESPQQIQQQAHIQVVSKDFYSSAGVPATPVPFGTLDSRLVRFR